MSTALSLFPPFFVPLTLSRVEVGKNSLGMKPRTTRMYTRVSMCFTRGELFATLVAMWKKAAAAAALQPRGRASERATDGETDRGASFLSSSPQRRGGGGGTSSVESPSPPPPFVAAAALQ